MPVCSNIKRAALVIDRRGVKVYRLWKSGHFMWFWFTLKPSAIEAEGPRWRDQFDARWLAKTCKERAEMKADLREGRLIMDAIARAIDAGELTDAWIQQRHDAQIAIAKAEAEERKKRIAEAPAIKGGILADDDLPF